MKNIKKIIIPVAVIAIIAALIAWKLSNNKAKMEKDAAVATIQTKTFPVSVIQPTMETVSQSVSENGIFKPYKELNFLSEVAGRVTNLYVKKGQSINAGTTIAKLDDKQINIDLDLAKITLAKNLSDMKKYQTMLAQNAINSQQVEDLKLTISNSESRVASLERQLHTTTIIAPISGIINDLKIEIGSYLTPSAPIAEIVNINTLKMEVMLLDKDVAQIRKGQSVKIIADLYPTAQFSGNVTAISSVGDATRKFAVEITFPNHSKMPLKAGMTGNSTFDFGAAKKGLYIPNTCIVGSVQDAKVFVVSGDKVALKPIVVGNSQGNNIQVISGLSSDDKVVFSGQLNITDGTAISIIK